MSELLQSSMEAIDFQKKDGTLANLTKEYEKINETIRGFDGDREKFTNSKDVKESLTNIEKAIFSRFGIPIKIIFKTSMAIPAGVMLPRIYTDTVLSKLKVKDFKTIDSDYWHTVTDALNDSIVNTGFKIDLKKAKIKGLPTKTPFYLYLNFFALLISYRLTPEEVTAVTMHEIGHIFTHLENMNSIVKINNVLGDGIRKNLSGKEIKEFSYRVRSLLPTDQAVKQYEDLTDSSSRTIWATNTYKLFINSFSDANEGRYSDTASEQLADQFATRMGLGVSLTNSLDKLYNSGYNNSDITFYARFTYLLYLGIQILLKIRAPYMIPLFILMAMTASLSTVGDSVRDMTYDDNIDRIRRIRFQMIELLKDDAVSNTNKKDIVDQINAIDNIIVNTKDNVGIFTKLVNTVWFRDRRVKRIKDMEKELEEIMSNNLYIREQELNNLS